MQTNRKSIENVNVDSGFVPKYNRQYSEEEWLCSIDHVHEILSRPPTQDLIEWRKKLDKLLMERPLEEPKEPEREIYDRCHGCWEHTHVPYVCLICGDQETRYCNEECWKSDDYHEGGCNR